MVNRMGRTTAASGVLRAEQEAQLALLLRTRARAAFLPPRAPPPQGAKSPLLWNEGQAAELLAGSPVVEEIEARLAGIEKEYEELDAVWFLAGRWAVEQWRPLVVSVLICA